MLHSFRYFRSNFCCFAGLVLVVEHSICNKYYVHRLFLAQDSGCDQQKCCGVDSGRGGRRRIEGFQGGNRNGCLRRGWNWQGRGFRKDFLTIALAGTPQQVGSGPIDKKGSLAIGVSIDVFDLAVGIFSGMDGRESTSQHCHCGNKFHGRTVNL